MNTIHRVGLAIAGVVALIIVAGAFVVQGYTSAQKAAAQTTALQATAQTTASPTATADVTLDPQTVYIAPVPTPPVIQITRPAPAVVSGPQPTAPVIHVVVPAPGGQEDDHGGDD